MSVSYTEFNVITKYCSAYSFSGKPVSSSIVHARKFSTTD